MLAHTNYLYSLSSAWLPPQSAYWQLEPELRLALTHNLDGQFPSRSEIAQSYEAFVSDTGTNAGAQVPIQSLYEPWTLDPACSLAFARSRGLRRGDAALHMDHVLTSQGIAFPDGLELDSDHLAVILNAAGVIAERFPEQLATFAKDHLVWVEAFEHQTAKVWGNDPRASFYRALLQETVRCIKPLMAYQGSLST